MIGSKERYDDIVEREHALANAQFAVVLYRRSQNPEFITIAEDLLRIASDYGARIDRFDYREIEGKRLKLEGIIKAI